MRGCGVGGVGSEDKKSEEKARSGEYALTSPLPPLHALDNLVAE
jgi:hypothetical protein